MGWVPCQINCISNPELAGRRYSRGNAETTGVRPGTQGIQGTLKFKFRPYVKGWEGPRRTCSEHSWGRFSASELRLGRIRTRRRHWHPTPVLLAGESHGQRSLVGCSPWGCRELDMIEWLHFHFSLSCIGEGNGNPLQCSCLENPRDGGAWWAAVYGVAQSQTRLKRLSRSSKARRRERKCREGCWKRLESVQ